MKKALILSFAGFHMCLIAVAMTNPKVNPQNPIVQTLSWYGKLTGASATYSFFSPDIPREMVFHFTIYKPDHTTFETTIQETANNEVNARVGNILRMVPKSYENRKIVRSMAASLSATMFRLFPEAEKVGIRSEIYMLPSMADWQAGSRTSMLPVYKALFAKDAGT